MKKIVAMVLCLVLALSLVGCGSGDKSKPVTYTDSEKNEVSYNEAKELFAVNGTQYYATGKEVTVEPTEDAIKYFKIPLSNDKVASAWFQIDENRIAVAIQNEWMEFITK